MTKTVVCVVFAFTCLFASFQIGESIRCWVCATRNDPTCTDPFNTTEVRVNPFGHLINTHTLTTCSDEHPTSPVMNTQRAVCQKRVTIGDGIQCWICQSNRDADCNDPFQSQNFPLMDCGLRFPGTPFKPDSCIKTIEVANGQRHIVRGCAWQDKHTERGKCTRPSGYDHIEVEYCGLCDVNGCNSAPNTVQLSTFVAFTAFMAALCGIRVFF